MSCMFILFVLAQLLFGCYNYQSPCFKGH